LLQKTTGPFLAEQQPPGVIVRATASYVLPDPPVLIGQCVRLAACRAARDKRFDRDPAIARQQKPSTFELSCCSQSDKPIAPINVGPMALEANRGRELFPCANSCQR
jgi:hypothetical protein